MTGKAGWLALVALGLCVASGAGMGSMPERGSMFDDGVRVEREMPARECCLACWGKGVAIGTAGREGIPEERRLSTVLLGVTVPLLVLAFVVARRMPSKARIVFTKEDDANRKEIYERLWEFVKTYDPVHQSRHAIILALHSLLITGGVAALAERAHPWLVILLSWFGASLLGIGMVIASNLQARLTWANTFLSETNASNPAARAHEFWFRAGYRDGLSSGRAMTWVVPGLFLVGYTALIIWAVYGLR